MARAIGVKLAVALSDLQILTEGGIGDVDGVVLNGLIDDWTNKNQSLSPGFGDHRQEDRKQDGNDGDHHQQLDERERLGARLRCSLHIAPLFWRDGNPNDNGERLWLQ